MAGGRAAIGTGPRVHVRAPRFSGVAALADLARASRRLRRLWVYPPETAAAVARWLRSAGSRRLRVLASQALVWGHRFHREGFSPWATRPRKRRDWP